MSGNILSLSEQMALEEYSEDPQWIKQSNTQKLKEYCSFNKNLSARIFTEVSLTFMTEQDEKYI